MRGLGRFFDDRIKLVIEIMIAVVFVFFDIQS